MSKPLEPERARRIGENVKELAGKVDAAGQKAAGETLRGSNLPFENESGTGRRIATLPTPDGGSIGIAYDPNTPPEADFGFSARAPDGNPRASSIAGTENGEVAVKPMDIGPAITKATGMDAAQMIVHFGLDTGSGGRNV